MAEIEKNEIYNEIANALEKEAKKKQLTKDQINSLMQEALESTKFQETIDMINLKTTGKRVIFVDGKGCLVYDEGVFYVEDSMDSKKGKRKLTKKQATELYVEYFFRYILNPAIEQKKLHQQVKMVADKAKNKEKSVKKEEKKNVKKMEELKKVEHENDIESKTKKTKSEMVR